MEYQYFGRPQRPKGANIKQALKAMLVLAVCAWLLYQIKHTRNKTENYGGQTKPVVAGYEVTSLGRKGIPSRLDERTLPDSRNIDSVSDGTKEGKAEEEELGHINEQFRTNEGKKVELEPESQPKVPSKNTCKESSKEKSGEVYIESRRSDKEKGVQLRFRKNAKHENEDPSIKEKKENKMQKNVVESATATNAGAIEEIDEVQSFHDENGVPPDGNETEIVFGHVHILHQENISDVSKGNWLEKIDVYEVASGEDNDAR